MHPQVHSADWITAHVLLALALVTAPCALARWALRNSKQPPVIAEIVVGLALGPWALGYLTGDLPQVLFPAATRPFLMALANVGLVLFLFVVGFEIDVQALRRTRGGATSVATASVLVFVATGMALTWWIRPAAASTSGPASPQLIQSLFIGVAFSATAFLVLARVLGGTALKRLPIRGLALSAGATGDVVSWTLLVAVVAATTGVGGASTAILLAESFGLVLALRYGARPAAIAAVRCTRGDERGAALAMSVISVGILLSSCVTAAMHLPPIFGAFAFGFVCPRDIVCQKAPMTVEKLADASKVLMPVFFVLTGLSMSVSNFGTHAVLVTALVIVATVAVKILSMYTTARACKVSSQDSWGLGLLMNTWGLAGLVILDVGRTTGVVSARMFTILAVMAIGTTLITGSVVERLYSGDANRSAWLTSWRGTRRQGEGIFRSQALGGVRRGIGQPVRAYLAVRVYTPAQLIQT